MIFQTEILNRFDTIAAYVLSPKTLQRIAEKSRVPNKYTEMHVWEVPARLLIAPIEVIASIFVSCISYILYAVQAKSLARRCQIFSEHIFHELEKLYHYCVYGDRLLVSSTSAHALFSTDLYLQKPLPILSIPDQAVRDTTFYPELNELVLYHEHGNCRGMADWFLYLCINSHHLFENIEDLLVVVAQELKNGATSEAGLLHSLKLNLNTYLGLGTAAYANYNGEAMQYHFKPIITQSLQQMPSGYYVTYLRRHVVVTIKTEDHNYYIFDSARGLFHLKDVNETVSYLSGIYDKSDPLSYLNFDQVGIPAVDAAQVG